MQVAHNTMFVQQTRLVRKGYRQVRVNVKNPGDISQLVGHPACDVIQHWETPAYDREGIWGAYSSAYKTNCGMCKSRSENYYTD